MVNSRRAGRCPEDVRGRESRPQGRRIVIGQHGLVVAHQRQSLSERDAALAFLLLQMFSLGVAQPRCWCLPAYRTLYTIR